MSASQHPHRSSVLCNACGKPLGTGTLLDLRPEAVPAAGMPTPIWRRFAGRYRCPICASVEPAVDASTDKAVPAVASCDRILVGQGGDTWDPLCVLPQGHKGRCRPDTALTRNQERA